MGSWLAASLLPAVPVVVWKAAYDGPDHGEDRLTGLVTDSAGNCWISGYSLGDTSDFDFATAMIGPKGTVVWTRRYGSPLGSEDRSWCLCRDSAGNVIAAGGSIAALDAGWDFALVKYDATGNVIWLRRYDSPLRWDDKPAALAVGPDDCLYIAGFSRRKPSGEDPRADCDVSLVRYSADGDTLWTRFFEGRAEKDDGAVAIAVDRSGNCYVAARAVNHPPGADIVLLKYRADGTLAWSRHIDGPGHGPDFPATVLLSDTPPTPGSPSRVFLVGSVTGSGTSYDYYASCLDTTGCILWQQTYDGSGTVDIASAACVDSAGNLVVTGQSAGTATSLDIATVSYSPDGEQRWVRRYNGQCNGADRGSCIVAGRQGGVIVGGSSVGATGFSAIVLLGYSAEGDTLWTSTHCGTDAGESRAVALGVRRDSTGAEQVLVAGCENNAASGSDYVLILLDEDE